MIPGQKLILRLMQRRWFSLRSGAAAAAAGSEPQVMTPLVVVVVRTIRFGANFRN